MVYAVRMPSVRQQQILDIAAKLFAERGFHGVSMNDIGAACGISGPALYKHFDSKDQILADSLTSISETLLSTGQARAAAAADDPRTALDALIDWHIEFALDHPDRIIIQEREWANLGEITRTDVRALQLAYIDIWVTTLRQLSPNLDKTEARAAAQAVFGLINSTPYSARINATRMRQLLATMAANALLGS